MCNFALVMSNILCKMFQSVAEIVQIRKFSVHVPTFAWNNCCYVLQVLCSDISAAIFAKLAEKKLTKLGKCDDRVLKYLFLLFSDFSSSFYDKVVYIFTRLCNQNIQTPCKSMIFLVLNKCNLGPCSSENLNLSTYGGHCWDTIAPET